jgi:hypothetical protein
MDTTTTRVQLALAPRAYLTLNTFKSLMGATSVTEVVRAALATIQWLQDRVSEGYEIAIVRDGQTIPVTRLLPIPLNPTVGSGDSETMRTTPAGSHH